MTTYAPAGQPQAAALPGPATPALVLDTQIVLDLWVFDDPASSGLRRRLEQAQLRWLATRPMREELARVLAYPQILKRLDLQGRPAQAVLQRWDQHACLCPVPPKAAPTCRDADDQKFIDLAVAHRVGLLSKDRALLCMKKPLLACGVWVAAALPLAAEAEADLGAAAGAGAGAGAAGRHPANIRALSGWGVKLSGAARGQP